MPLLSHVAHSTRVCVYVYVEYATHDPGSTKMCCFVPYLHRMDRMCNLDAFILLQYQNEPIPVSVDAAHLLVCCCRRLYKQDGCRKCPSLYTGAIACLSNPKDLPICVGLYLQSIRGLGPWQGLHCVQGEKEADNMLLRNKACAEKCEGMCSSRGGLLLLAALRRCECWLQGTHVSTGVMWRFPCRSEP